MPHVVEHKIAKAANSNLQDQDGPFLTRRNECALAAVPENVAKIYMRSGGAFQQRFPMEPCQICRLRTSSLWLAACAEKAWLSVCHKRLHQSLQAF